MLEKTGFGALEQERYTRPEGVIVHVAITIDSAPIALADNSPDWGNTSPTELGASTVPITLECNAPN